MKLTDLSDWAKSMFQKSNIELLKLGVIEVKIEKSRGELRAISERLDIVVKEVVKHDRFLNDNDRSLSQLLKWGVPLPADEKSRLEKLMGQKEVIPDGRDQKTK